MSAKFDETFYLTTNPDVFQAVLAGTIKSGAEHYEKWGAKELRNPNSTFNTAEYLVNNLDVLAAVQSGAFPTAFAHFQVFGMKEGRTPGNTLFTGVFDNAAYLNANPDVKAAVDAGSFLSGLDHWLQWGRNEVRTGVQKTDGTAITGGTTTPGQTFTLTTNPDNIAGTSGDDTVNGYVNFNNTQSPGSASTFTVVDTIAATGGTDTLNVTLENANGAVGLPLANISGVENFFLRNLTGQTLTANAGNFEGEQQLWSDRSTHQIDFTNVAAGTIIGVKGDGLTTNATTTAAYGASVTAGAVAITGGTTAGDITLTGAGLTSATITTSGTAKNTVGTINVANAKTITIDGTANLTATAITTGATDGTLTVKGAGAFSLGTLNAGIDTVDASASTGGVTLILDAETDTKFTGGSGNDKVTTGAALTTGTVDGGAGTADQITIAANAHLTSTTGAKYTNFEVLGVANNVTVDLDHISGITSVVIDDGAGTTVANDLSATQAAAVTMTDIEGAFTIGVKGATTVGQLDTVHITVDNGNTTTSEDISTAAGTPTLAGVETLKITAVDDAEITLSNATTPALTKVELLGAGNHTLITGNIANANFILDASASTSANTLDASTYATNGIAITGGSAVDTITGSAQADVIKGGAGNDIINGSAGNDTIEGGDGDDTITVSNATQADTLAGGAGADIFKFSAADLADTLKTSSGTTGVTKITDFVAGTDKIGIVDTDGANTSITLAGPQTIASAADLAAVYGGISAIAGSVDGGALNGVVVTVSAGAAAGTYLYINDATGAVASADDLLINITGITGTLAATDFVFA